MLSPNTGRLRVVAKGIRKTKSRFGGRLEPFTQVDLVALRGSRPGHGHPSGGDRGVPGAPASPRPGRGCRGDGGGSRCRGPRGRPSARLFLLLQRGLRALETVGSSPTCSPPTCSNWLRRSGWRPRWTAAPAAAAPARFGSASMPVVRCCYRCRPDGSVRLRRGGGAACCLGRRRSRRPPPGRPITGRRVVRGHPTIRRASLDRRLTAGDEW